MTLPQNLDLLRVALTIAAPALVLAAGLKRAPSRRLARIAAVTRREPRRLDGRG